MPLLKFDELSNEHTFGAPRANLKFQANLKKFAYNRPGIFFFQFFCQIPKVVSESNFDVQYRNNDPDYGGVTVN